MADRCEHTSMYPDLHWLYHSPRSSHILGSTIVAQNLLRDPALLVHRNSLQPSPNISSSSVITPKKQVHPREQNPWSYAILQGMSQVISASAVAPIERVYSLIQCQNEMLKYGHLSTPYKGMMDCFRRTIKNEGVLSLWQGNSMNVITPLTIEVILQFSLSLDLHWLYHSPRSSHILGSTIVAQNLLRDPALLVHRNSLQPSPNISSSSVITPKKQVHPREQNPWSYAILQGMSQVISASAVAPIERVYSLIQCQNEMLKYGHLSTPYKGMMDCFRRTIKNEGVLSLWQGNSMNVITPLTIEASMFAFVHLRRNSTLFKEVHEPPLWFLPLGGMLGLLLRYPLDFTRIRLANDVKAAQVHFSLDSSGKNISNAIGNWKFNGAFDVFKKTLRLEGIVGFYRGYTAACVGVFAYQASTVFKSYYRDRLTKEKHTYSARFAPIIFMGLPVIFYPILTISHRMMMTSGEVIKYKGAVDAVCQIVKREGASSLYKGLGAYVVYCCANKGLGAYVVYCCAKDAIVLAFIYLAYSRIDNLRK